MSFFLFFLTTDSFLYLLVQSAERSPSYLTERSLDFVKDFRQRLADMPAAKLRYIKCTQRSTMMYCGVRLTGHLTLTIWITHRVQSKVTYAPRSQIATLVSDLKGRLVPVGDCELMSSQDQLLQWVMTKITRDMGYSNSYAYYNCNNETNNKKKKKRN